MFELKQMCCSLSEGGNFSCDGNFELNIYSVRAFIDNDLLQIACK